MRLALCNIELDPSSGPIQPNVDTPAGPGNSSDTLATREGMLKGGFNDTWFVKPLSKSLLDVAHRSRPGHGCGPSRPG